MSKTLRFDYNLMCSALLPRNALGPRWGARGFGAAEYDALAARGYHGVQQALLMTPRRDRCEAAHLKRTGSALIDPRRILGQAKRWVDEGYDAATLLVGDGFEDVEGAVRKLDAVLEAQAKTGLPLYVETHRGTITQDLQVTLALVGRRPEVRFNADLSHYVTGHALASSDALPRLDSLGPILSRVRFMHGRLSGPRGAQVHQGPSHQLYPLFRELWTRCFVGYLEDEDTEREFIFAPELLPVITGYAEVEQSGGALREVGDRSGLADGLCAAAKACFDEARIRVARSSEAPPWSEVMAACDLTPLDPGAPVVTTERNTTVVRALTPEAFHAALEHPLVGAGGVVRLRLGNGLEDWTEMRDWAGRVLSAARDLAGRSSGRGPRLVCETSPGTFLRHLHSASRLAEQTPELRFALDAPRLFLSHEWLPHRLPRARARLRTLGRQSDLLVIGHSGPARVGRLGARGPRIAETMDQLATGFLKRVWSDALAGRRGVLWTPSEWLDSRDAAGVARWLHKRGAARH